MTRTVLLGDIATIHDKKRVPLNSRQRSERQGDIPYYGATGILDYIDKPLFDGEYVLIGEDGENLRSKKSDLAFKVSGKFWVNNHAHILQGNEQWINDYIVSVFRALDISPYITGAAQPKLNQAALMRIPIYWPSEDEAKRITDILSTIDEKIKLNRKMNETLEQMGQALFRHYFIDNPNAEKWKRVPLSELCENIGSGGTPSTRDKSYYGGDVLWFSTKELSDGFLFSSEKTITEEGLNKSAAKLFPVNTVTMAIYAAPTVGRLGILTGKASFNQATCGLVSKQEIGYEFIYLYLLLSRAELNNMANGAAQQNISVGKVRDFKVMDPDTNALTSFRTKIEPIFQQIRNNTEQIQTLTALRDTLLPRLINGKVKV